MFPLGVILGWAASFWHVEFSLFCRCLLALIVFVYFRVILVFRCVFLVIDCPGIFTPVLERVEDHPDVWMSLVKAARWCRPLKRPFMS